MTPEQHRMLYGPGHKPPGHAVSPNAGKCANVRVTTKDGRVFDLGAPDSPFFPLRRWFYKFRRRNELKGAIDG